MPKSTLFDTVTSAENIEQHAKIILDLWQLEGHAGVPGWYLKMKSLSMKAPSVSDGDPWPAVNYYRGEAIPPWVGELLLEDRKPKKEGRNASPESRALQLARDWACYIAVHHLTSRGMKRSPAEAITGKRMNLSRQAVGDACEREESRLAASPPAKRIKKRISGK